MALLQIEDLSLAFAARGGERPVLEHVSMHLERGEIVGVVGESGSGKTMLARSILRLWPPGARVTGGAVRLDAEELLLATDARLRQVRGARIGMVFQEPMTSLNPALKIGFQLAEGLREHTKLGPGEIRERILAMLRTLGLPDPQGSLARYPHEFSGGMRQRLMLASVLSLQPAVLIADEPTTALDAIIARQVLEAMVRATAELGTAVMLVSHDLSAVCRFAQRVVVMRNGRVVESGPTERILLDPQDPYTRALLEALPRRKMRPVARYSEPVASARELRVRYARRSGWPWSPPPPFVLDGVSIDVRQGETIALVGESGSGKSTLGRALLGLVPVTRGSVSLLGTPLSGKRAHVPLAVRRRAQLVFQDPFAALDPRMRVGAIVGEGLRHFAGLNAAARRARVAAMLQEVGLAEEYATRYPHELSGGQRQRVVIARALVMEPQLVVADEPVSALDVTVQAQVLGLLAQLQQRFGFAMLFISHDLAVVAQVADRIAIVHHGRIVEWGDARPILESPAHPYTRELWSAAPRLKRMHAGYALALDSPQPVDAPPGLRFASPEDSVAALRTAELGEGRYVLCAG